MTPQQNQQIRPVTRPIVEEITNGVFEPNIRAIYLFGSEARGEARLTSDIDIALISDAPLTYKERRAFSQQFDEVDYPHINIINTLTTSLDAESDLHVGYHIKREGLLLYERKALVH